MPKAYLELDEVKKLEDAAEYLRDKLMIQLLFRLGCRISEALGIEVDNIDFGQGTITIEHLKLRLNLSCPSCGVRLSKQARFCPGCGIKVDKPVAKEREHRRVRTLPIDNDTLKMLKEYIDRGGPISHNGKQLLFGIDRHRAWQIVRDCADRAGLPKLTYSESGKEHGVSPHRLRDAFAIHAVKQDGSADGIRVLQEHLGHQSIATTMRYRKLSGEEHRRWLDKVFGCKEVNDARVGDSNHK